MGFITRGLSSFVGLLSTSFFGRFGSFIGTWVIGLYGLFLIRRPTLMFFFGTIGVPVHLIYIFYAMGKRVNFGTNIRRISGLIKGVRSIGRRITLLMGGLTLTIRGVIMLRNLLSSYGISTFGLLL